ncbi:MAG: hypothetical protein LBM75_03555 [Myxococcales bacterium]|jgi:hypothetical protein|nr:hypothetical protein [Myxococcales bacterium]
MTPTFPRVALAPLLCCLAISVASACASLSGQGDPRELSFQPGRWLVLRTNLHHTPQGEISALNYQPQNILPRCTEVLLLGIDGEEMTFRAGEMEYVWRFSDRIREDRYDHLFHFFAPRCETRTLNDIDKLGIQQGKAKVGMTRWGVLYALGYPPDDVTPDIAADVWTYWRYQDFQMKVVFENDVVTFVK